MLLVMCTLLSLLELSRYQAIKGLAKLQTETTLESAFANYSSILWEQYHLLACSQEEIESQIESAGESRLDSFGKRHNLLLFQNKEASITKCMRITDGNGAAYIQSVASYMKQNILYEAAKQIYNQYEALAELEESAGLDLDNVEEALKELEEEAQKLANEDNEDNVENVENGVNKVNGENTTGTVNSVGTSKEKNSEQENPLEVFQKLQEKGILELLLEDTDNLSEAELTLADCVSQRELEEGDMDIHLDETDWLDKVLLQQYFLTYLSCYGQVKEGHYLAYELEYLIGGKETDLENLKIAVSELLGLRAACNFLYLMSDAEKLEEAGLLAATLAGGNLALLEVVKVGLLTAWAFSEGVLDVRALLQNKKIPLVKSKELWTLELTNISSVIQEDCVAKSSKQGLIYADYLGLLLFFSSKENLAMRGMDVQEATIGKQNENASFSMDLMLVQVEATITYGYKPIFYKMEEVDITRDWKYEIICYEKYGYF